MFGAYAYGYKSKTKHASEKMEINCRFTLDKYYRKYVAHNAHASGLGTELVGSIPTDPDEFFSKSFILNTKYWAHFFSLP